MGITLREIILTSRRHSAGARVQAVQTAPSGGCLPASHLTCRRLRQPDGGGSYGSARMIVMDDQTCMVDVARYLSVPHRESCGNASPAAKAAVPLDVLTRITRQGERATSNCSRRWRVMQTPACAPRSSAPNPVISTLRYFATSTTRTYASTGPGRRVQGHQVRDHQSKCDGVPCLLTASHRGHHRQVKYPHLLNQDLCISARLHRGVQAQRAAGVTPVPECWRPR